MNMQFTISEKESGSLNISIVGSRVELTGFTSGRKVTVDGAFGDISVRVVPSEAQAEAQPEEETAATILVDTPVVAVEKPEQSLFQCLAALRKQISSEVSLPPYIIFHDTTLKDMCRVLPSDLQTLKDVSGVGEAKLAKYGSRFIEVIGQYVSTYGVEGVTDYGGF